MSNNLSEAVSNAARKWRRDSGLSVSQRFYKAYRYLRAMIVPPWWRWGITTHGHTLRIMGRPRIENHGRVAFGDDVFLRSATIPVEIYVTPGAEIVVGSHCVFNSGVSLAATRSITLGSRVYLGPLVFIMDNSFHELNNHDATPAGSPVVLEDDVWIGVKATVLPGVRIGRGSVVGAHSLVTRDVPPFSLVAGSPARVIRSLQDQGPRSDPP